MTTAVTTVTAECWVQVQPVRSPYTNASVRAAKALRLTQHRPADLLNGCVAIKVNLQIPVEAFAALAVDALVVVPDIDPVDVDAQVAS